jgi:hypothetical protein
MWVSQVDYADCEAHDGGLFAQDVNAWSSIAYIVVGAIIAAVVTRRRMPIVFLGLAAALVAEGVGSVLYHGEPSAGTRVLHDAAAVAILGFIAGWHTGRLARSRAAAGATIGLGAGLVAGIVGGLSTAMVTNGAVAVGVGLVVTAEVSARRRRLVPVPNAATLVLGALAVLTWGLGTSDSPLCAPDSWAQPHGAWHVLSALAVLAWAGQAAAAESS